MFRGLHIEGFRCFRALRVAPLGRVNLIVGKNSSGKTALLDAVELLVHGDPAPLWLSPIRRCEFMRKTNVDAITGKLSQQLYVQIAHLFYGHKLNDAAVFVIQTAERNLFVKIFMAPALEPLRRGEMQVLLRRFPEDSGPVLALEADGTLPILEDRVSLTRPQPPVLFLDTQIPDTQRLSKLWDEVMLTDDEALLIEAMRIIESRVERVAFRGEGPDRNIVVKLKGERNPQLLGSLGDGMRHLLALALHLVPAKGGYLLVDEIDTGLHYSVMEKMWSLIIQTAKRLDIQVFATTHSADCIKALAGVHALTPLTPEDLMVHRVVAGMDHTITFTPEDLKAVAEFQGEVR